MVCLLAFLSGAVIREDERWVTLTPRQIQQQVDTNSACPATDPNGPVVNVRIHPDEPHVYYVTCADGVVAMVGTK